MYASCIALVSRVLIKCVIGLLKVYFSVVITLGTVIICVLAAFTNLSVQYNKKMVHEKRKSTTFPQKELNGISGVNRRMNDLSGVNRRMNGVIGYFPNVFMTDDDESEEDENTDFEPRSKGHAPNLSRDSKSSSSDSGCSPHYTQVVKHRTSPKPVKKYVDDPGRCTSPTAAVKLASKEVGKSEDEILRTLKHNLTTPSANCSESATGSRVRPLPREGRLKTTKKAISFSSDPVTEPVAPRSPLPSGTVLPSALKPSKNLHTVKVDVHEFPNTNSVKDYDHHDYCVENSLEHQNGMCRLSSISNSHSNISGLSNISDLSPDYSSENPSPVYPPNYFDDVGPKNGRRTNFKDKTDSNHRSNTTDRMNNLSVNGNGRHHSTGTVNTDTRKQKTLLDSSKQNSLQFHPDLDIGSVVEVLENPPRYGVIRWIGSLPEAKDPKKQVAGLEMEEECSACTDGTFNGRRIFQCPPKKGFFVYLNKVRKDSRFQEEKNNKGEIDFGDEESPDVPGNVSPPSAPKLLVNICGKSKGLQGHNNSCYLDATLFSMFAFTQVFDTILHRPRKPSDFEQYDEVQRVLRESIVNPLRKCFYVRADKMLRLRTLLDKLSTVNGMMGEEKDPEEFLNSLLQQTLKADPLIRLSSGQESYYYQLFIEKDDRIVLPTTQQLLGLSFLQSDIKLAEIPSCLILQMPRFGKDYKMYNRIVPSLYLDITDILQNAPRECCICGKLAEYECKQCYLFYSSNSFCSMCLKQNHSHPKRVNHTTKPLAVPEAYEEFLNEQKKLLGDKNVQIDRETMELFAVVCIETSHYVAFVKCGPGQKAPWVFFDSMADRKGQEHGYNIPEVQPCPDLTEWLSDEKLKSYKDDRQLPPYARRILCDAYMCLYQSTDVMMYK